MPQSKSQSHCGRRPDQKEILRTDARFDYAEDHILTIARFFFQSFACPQSHAWLRASDIAQTAFGDEIGPIIAARLVDVLRSVREARRSVFHFNSPVCEGCAAIVSEHERRLMGALQAVCRGNAGRAQTELMMLCEGNNITQSLGAMTRLSLMLPLAQMQAEVPADV
ncbi:hypothetical protein [Cognatiyoonia sp. IB215182]|uniref:hypothetical protein n=1 Tax=Cognatiyoonia sp. IB215182 TaxID=3097353 RepID=UPI002A0B261F|nr:hypothetical protein [Cognatiyoonia sp. IB215182]MDX8354795.1 hypothetical protein [Cognatiyoonia sp. IB215182]